MECRVCLGEAQFETGNKKDKVCSIQCARTYFGDVDVLVKPFIQSERNVHPSLINAQREMLKERNYDHGLKHAGLLALSKHIGDEIGLSDLPVEMITKIISATEVVNWEAFFNIGPAYKQIMVTNFDYMLKQRGETMGTVKMMIPTLVKEKNLNTLRELIGWGSRMNFPSSFGLGILVDAILHGDGEAVKVVLDWRGPNGEFVDPIQQYEVPLQFTVVGMASKNNKKEALSLLLNWRGPKGEFISLADPNQGRNIYRWYGTMELFKLALDWRGPNGEEIKYPYYISDSYVHDYVLRAGQGDAKVGGFLQALIEWRGSDGEFVDLSKQKLMVEAAMEYAPLVLRQILEWRGPNGEFVDPSRKSDLFSIITRNNASEGKWSETRLKMILEWRGPNGEFVDLSKEFLGLSVFDYLVERSLERGRKWPFSLLEMILEWRGPNGEFVDVTARDNLLLAKAVAKKDLVTMKMLLDWVGPNGEKVPLIAGVPTKLVNSKKTPRQVLETIQAASSVDMFY